jgi:hypothetical protein
MKSMSIRALLLSLLVLLTLSAAAQAQATRTWVSGVGDDANPCSRTAPCKTFAGAISKTATNGEINVLDPGGFGGVTITKSITISSEGFEAGVLVSGTNAIIINAGNTGVVTLRGLDIEGLTTGLTGIRVLSAGAVHIENCTINRFTQFGIDFAPTSVTAHTAQLHVSNTIVRNNAGAASGGIRIKPGTNVAAVGMLTNTELRNNFVGLRVEDNSKVTATDSVASGNATAGFLAVGNSLAATLNLYGCSAIGNLNGIKADLGLALVRVSDCMVAGNGTGFNTSAAGHIATFGDVMNADTINGAIDGDIAKQ